MGDDTDITKHSGYRSDDTGGAGSLFGLDLTDRNSYVEDSRGLRDAVPVVSHIDSIASAAKKLGDGEDVLADLGAIGLQITDLAGKVGGIILDPIGWLAGAGLGILIDFVQPLEDFLGLVSGNPERMGEESKKWGAVGDTLAPLAAQVRSAADEDLVNWAGTTGATARTRLHQLADAVDSVAVQVRNLVAVMETAKAMATVVQGLIKSEIGSFISERVIAWAYATATAPMSFGASYGVFVAHTMVAFAGTMKRVKTWAYTSTKIFAQILAAMTRLSGYLSANAKLFSIVKTVPGLMSASSATGTPMPDPAIADAMR